MGKKFPHTFFYKKSVPVIFLLNWHVVFIKAESETKVFVGVKVFSWASPFLQRGRQQGLPFSALSLCTS